MINQLRKILRSPIFYFAFFAGVYSIAQRVNDKSILEVISSDGRGCYAYLPALLIYHDGSFEQSSKVEKSYYANGIDQLYLFKNKEDKTYNKYFPGIAVLQLPFFLLACFVSWVIGTPIDGYSSVFHWCYLIGSWCYFMVGIQLFASAIRRLFPERNRQFEWIIPLIYLATPLLFYSISTPSFTHVYSFFLIGLFVIQIIKLREGLTKRKLLFLGITLGMVILVRPTNVTILFIVPFLLGKNELFIERLKELITLRNGYFLTTVLGTFSVLSVLFLSWKWQTGNWLVWSYSGEGFNFTNPLIVTGLFSFRIGLFVHTPIVLLACWGILTWYRKNAFQAIWWCVYFVVNCWVIFSWWCWDYESSFGNRPFVEHIGLILLPVFFMLQRRFILTVGIVSLCAAIGLIRFWEKSTGFMVDQRYTKQNFLPSLQFWKAENSGRWNFTKSCKPFGKSNQTVVLLDDPTKRVVASSDEFTATVEYELPKNRTNERYYVVVDLEKKIESFRFENVFLVIDAFSGDEKKRYYKSIDLFNDREEGKEEWAKLSFEVNVHDYLQEYDHVKIYIWNPGKKKFILQNIKIVLEEYKS